MTTIFLEHSVSLNSSLYNILIGSGKVAKIFFIGDEHIKGPDDYLKYTVDQYNTTLGNLHMRITIRVYEIVQGTVLSTL